MLGDEKKDGHYSGLQAALHGALCRQLLKPSSSLGDVRLGGLCPRDRGSREPVSRLVTVLCSQAFVTEP